MRSGRSFLALLVVAAGLAAYIYFVESKRDPFGGAASAKDKVFAVDSSTFEEVEVRAASGEVTTLRKVNGLWEIASPEALPTDSGEIGSLLSTLDTLEIQHVIDETPASPAEFGLEPARFSVAFRAAGETSLTRLELGRKTPTGGDVYARVEGQPRVFLISGWLEDSLNKTTFALRDKTVLKFERDAADTLTVEASGAAPLSFARKGEDWRFTAPWDAKADYNQVDGLVGRLYQARMTSVVASDGLADLRKYGLDRPQATAIVGTGSGRATLALGTKAEDGGLYARDMSRPMVFTVDATLLDDLKKNPDDLRRRDIFEFRSYSALGMEATLGGRTWTFEKQKAAPPADPSAAAPPDVWTLAGAGSGDIDQDAVSDFLMTVSNLRAESFATQALASGEDLLLKVRFGDEASPGTNEVRFRKSGGTVHALLSGESGAAIIPTTEFDRALELLKKLTGQQ
jgi:hypothetical protein